MSGQLWYMYWHTCQCQMGRVKISAHVLMLLVLVVQKTICYVRTKHRLRILSDGSSKAGSLFRTTTKKETTITPRDSNNEGHTCTVCKILVCAAWKGSHKGRTCKLATHPTCENHLDCTKKPINLYQKAPQIYTNKPPT